VEDALARQQLSIRPVMSLGSSEAVKNAVMAGLGAAFVSSLTVELELSGGRLRRLQLEGFQLLRALSLLMLEGRPPSPVATEFLRLLRARYPK
jgi:DNA-binding transcriptional LysR family regulator